MRLLIGATREVIRKIVQSIVGLWSFFLQLNRPVYSVLEGVYFYILSTAPSVF